MSVQYIEADTLAEMIKNKQRDFLIVDVRDTDYAGGHITGAVNIPAHTIIDRAHELVVEYEQVPLMVFHCALSQVRGPKSARIYNEAKQHLRPNSSQQVKVLRYGFEGWLSKHHQDGLIEDYDPAVWAWTM
ncbi:Rhodanese-like protein [Spinellus fusiger]|nr:Rhodanese-like protein [Spinellus fusiger]